MAPSINKTNDVQIYREYIEKITEITSGFER